MQKETYSVEESKYIKVGLYVAMVILCIISYYAYIPKHSQSDVDNKFYDITARFNRTDGLLVGDKVRMTGLTIGKVVDAKLDDHFKAILTLEINHGINIPDDSSASIVSSGLMGSKYIEIEAGGSDTYMIPSSEFEYTQDAMVIEELLDRIISMGKSTRSQHSEPTKGNI